ncbi:hypothetical protein B0H10DRAFT_2241010 [Mycena sp. CBHHK59/15]|nr:hypothetical protein B0H10DRAFT_2241010 [Mycena sp. CBHHK59/15]
MASKYPLFIFAFLFGILFLQQGSGVLKTWMLGHWAKQYDDRPAEQVDVVFFLSIFIAIVFTSIITMSAAFICVVFGQLKASKVPVWQKRCVFGIDADSLRSLHSAPTARNGAQGGGSVNAMN